MSEKRTLYETLGAKPLATSGEIRDAYWKLARTEHPDAGGTVDRFMVIVQAYSILSDPDKRKAYDTLLGLQMLKCKKCNGAGSRYSARSALALDCPVCDGLGFVPKLKKRTT